MIDEISMTPIALSFTVLMSVLTLLLPRRYAIYPLIVSVCYVTIGQQILVLSLHFSIFRIIILMGFLRVIIRHDIAPIRLNVIDKTILWWVVIGLLMGLFNEPTVSDLIERAGYAYNAVGTYFLIRFYLIDFDETNRIIKFIALLIVPLAILMLVEQSTGRNMFSFFGGVPEMSELRDGRLRCQGPFRHPIIAGTFGATLMPLMVGLFFKSRTRLIAMMGFISATIITATSASSGPLMAYLFGIVGFAMWPFRNHMRLIRWGILFAIIGLHIYMKDPVWFVIARVSDITGGTGWHRSQLINQAINYFSEWWLVGTKYTKHWMMENSMLSNPNMCDITNQYIWEGVGGGLIKMILFITIIVLSFRAVGLSLTAVKDKPFAIKVMIWSVGVALFTHAVSYISIVYFDQIIVIWFLLLAMISTLPKASENVAAEAIYEPKDGEIRTI